MFDREAVMPPVIDRPVVTRIRILVRDVDSATVRWSEFLGAGPVIGPVPAGKGPGMAVRYLGDPAPDAEIRVSLFQVGEENFIELMEPNEHPSVWREALDRSGEGLHSISFDVPDMDAAVRASSDLGGRVLQEGVFESGDGRYAYLDHSAQLGAVIELEQMDVPLADLLAAVRAGSSPAPGMTAPVD